MIIAVTTTGRPRPIYGSVPDTELEGRARLAAYRHVYYGDKDDNELDEHDKKNYSSHTEVIRPSAEILLYGA